MDKPQPFWRFLLEISLIAAFVVVMYVVLEFFHAHIRPMAPPEATENASSPILGSGDSIQIEAESSPYPPPPYPPPGSDAPHPSYPAIVQDLYSKASYFAGAKAATLVQGSIWVVSSDAQPEAPIDFGDVSVIFGWSYDGSKLLFGRGLYPTYGELSEATELWFYDTVSGEMRPLSDSQKVWSAGWSPVDDRLAYCEYGNLLTIESLDGTVLDQQDGILCDFTWSPDGSAIAVRYTAPDMVLSDGVRTNVLTLWWLEKDELQFLSDAKFEDHSKPLWSIDGQHILFYREFTEKSEPGINGFYLIDTLSGEMKYLRDGPQYYPDHQSRSPRADALVFNVGEEIYVMEFDGKPILIGRGSSPTWLSDGVTLIYRGEDGLLNTAGVSIKTTDQTVGGWQCSPHVRIHPNFFFVQEGLPFEAESNPYPPPNPSPGGTQPPYFPRIIQDLYSKAASFAGARAAILAEGSIWLVQADRQPEVLVDFGDVSVIYGWNHDDTKLLFGRGLYETSGELAKSTELWVYDSNAGKAYRLIDSTRVWSASWSPVDDRVAYCEYGENPTVYVVSLEGEVLQKRGEYFFSDLAWSPDGSAIAVNYSGPELVEYDTKYSVLGIWWLEKDELQLVSDAKREAHDFPVWLTDGSHILFTRIFGPGSEGGESGLYIVDIQTMQMLPLQNGPKSIVNRMMRSPRSDNLVFWKGYEIYVMESGKEPILIGRGSLPVWHPDGKTIFYVEEASGLYQMNSFDLAVGDQVMGGYFSASTIHLQPSLFFQKGINH